MPNKMFTVSIDKEYDVLKKEFNNSIYLRVYTSLFQSGIVKDLKPTNFTVLLAIASFMDAEGNCYPTQRQISEITGISTPTVNKAIKELLDYKVNDIAIISREFVQQGQFKNSYYTVNPLSQIAIFDGQVKEILTEHVKESEHDPLKEFELNNNQLTISNKQEAEAPSKESEQVTEVQEITFKNAKEVAVYFIDKYREVYGVQPSISWAKDLGLIKGKLKKNYSDAHIQIMIDTAVTEYDKRWRNAGFQRPTIGMICGWLGEQALALAVNEDKEYKAIEELTADSDDSNDDVLSKFGVKK